MNLFNTNLKLLRDELNLSQNEIASVMDITPAMVDSIEKGDSNLDCGALTLLCQQYPAVDLNWFIKGQGSASSSEYRVVTVGESAPGEMSEERLDRGEYEDALIEFLTEGSEEDYVEPIRVDTPLLPIFRYKDRYYLVIVYGEYDEIIKIQVSRCLWCTPTSLLSQYMRASDIKGMVLQIAAYFRENHRFYGNPVAHQFPEVDAFNKLLETLILDKELLKDKVYDSVPDTKILPININALFGEIDYEGEKYLIYDVTI